MFFLSTSLDCLALLYITANGHMPTRRSPSAANRLNDHLETLQIALEHHCDKGRGDGQGTGAEVRQDVPMYRANLRILEYQVMRPEASGRECPKEPIADLRDIR